MSTLIQQGGPAALQTLYLAGPTFALSLAYAITLRRWAWWAAAAATALLLGLGVLGYLDASSTLDRALDAREHDSSYSREDLARMREDGGREARIPLQMAGVLAGACAVVLVAGRIRAARTK